MDCSVKDIQLALEEMKRWESEGVAPCDDTAAYVQDIQQSIAQAAEQLGMSREQHELEELSVKLGYPEDYKRLKQLLSESEASCEMVFHTFALPIRAMLDDLGIEYEFKYRMKSVYSIWHKMKKYNQYFDDVYDLFATRIVYKPKDEIDPLPGMPPNEVDTLDEASEVKEWQLQHMDKERFYCWRIYTVISSLYRIHPERIRNWISTPRPSGYQALQLTVMGPDCNWIEIQIRSQRMDYEAEHGSASHWKYKQSMFAI